MLLLRYLLWFLTRCVLALRYRLRVHGREQLRGLKSPVLILPNHPGYIDPPLVLAALWPALKPRPMVYEGIYRNPLLWPFLKLLRGLPVPDLNVRASAQAREKAQTAVQAVMEGLKRGENYILWPSGRIRRGGDGEVLGGARALTEILKAAPNATIVLVRTTGVWGSMFSYARTGDEPALTKRLFVGIGLLFANLLFFAPRRRVDITVEKLDRARLPELRREQINPWFEEWYNSQGPSKPLFTPYHFLFGPRQFEFPKADDQDKVDLKKIKPETREAVNHLIAEKLHRPLDEQESKPETALDQLGLDSLDRAELMLQVEQRFGFSGGEVPANLGQMWALAQGLAATAAPKPPAAAWRRPISGDPTPVVRGDTIPEAFVTRALASPHDIAAADDLAGVLTYERMLVGVRLLAKRFAQIPAPNVGLLMPASAAGDMALLGLSMAGKLPILLNWTTGPVNLAHAARLMNLTHVVTSLAFIDRTAVAVEGTEYLYLEDLRKSIRFLERLTALLAVRLHPGGARKSVPLLARDQPAVVLFTSGSEKAPKAVPLTHANLLSNQRGGLAVLGFTRRDSMLGCLPLFHSFGMNATTLLPLGSGIRVVHHPDPTDAAGLVRKIAAYQTTVLIATPTFLSQILDRAKPGDLDSLRHIIAGAEKCPDALFDRCAAAAPNAALREGYGVTECSPVVAANTPSASRRGTVGKALPGVELCILDLDSGKPLGLNRLGLLLAAGPSVFPGYIDHDGPSPFREIDGKRWYITGDLAEIDDDGFIHFRGRLKRFLKAGGEMISLPALEEPFARRWPPTEDGPRVAVEGVETEGGRRIVLFSTESLNVRDANSQLMEEGFRGVMRLDEVRRVEKIPVLGTGKTDYKALRGVLETQPACTFVPAAQTR